MGEPREPHRGQDDELILAIWDGDENAKGQLVVRFAPALERAIAGQFRRLHSGEVEDVVAEAIRRFWEVRARYDPDKWPLGVCLYRAAKQVAAEYTSGRLKWQKARLLERRVDDSELWRQADRASQDLEDRLDLIEGKGSALVAAFAQEFGKLSSLEQEIWQAYADAGDFELDSATLGIEMGQRHNSGVPYTGVNIRVMKHRAKAKLERAMETRGFDLKQVGPSDA